MKHIIPKTIFLAIILSWFNVSYGQAPEWDWIAKAGGTGDDEALSTASDNDGNIIVAGYFSGSIVFGSYTLSSSGASDFFIAKYDSSGNVIWAKKGGGSLNDQITSITTDPWGNIIVTGAFQSSTMTIDTLSLLNSGSWDSFVAKYNPQGDAQWAKRLIDPEHDNANCVIADSTSIIIGGRFKNNIIIENDTLFNVSTGTYAFDTYIVKYDTLGNAIWAKSAGGTNQDEINSLSFDNNKNILATGTYVNSTISFDTISLINSGSFDLFLTKYNSSGDVVWAKKAGGSFSDYAYAVTTDLNNNVIISGYFSSSTMYFDLDSIVNAGGYGLDIFLAKYDNNGNLLWVKQAGNTSGDVTYSIQSDANNNIIIAGNYDIWLDGLPLIFGTDTLIEKGIWDIFLTKYDEFGNVIWAKGIGGNNYDETHSNCLHISPNGSIILAGGFISDTIVFDSISLINANLPNSTTRDMFLAVLSPEDSIVGLGLKENLPRLMVLFPNPTNGILYLESSIAIFQIKIFNSLGQLVTSKSMDGQKNLTWTFESSGIYFMQITTEKQIMTKKIIVKK